MAIVRWEPYFPKTFSRFPALWDEDEEWQGGDNLSVYETDDSLIVKASVAGVPADKVDVTVEGGVITIKAEYSETEEEKKKKKVIYREARSANYLYTTSVPCPVEADQAKAEVEDGVVTVTIPKAEAAKPKKITVKAKGK